MRETELCPNRLSSRSPLRIGDKQIFFSRTRRRRVSAASLSDREAARTVRPALGPATTARQSETTAAPPTSPICAAPSRATTARPPTPIGALARLESRSGAGRAPRLTRLVRARRRRWRRRRRRHRAGLTAVLQTTPRSILGGARELCWLERRGVSSLLCRPFARIPSNSITPRRAALKRPTSNHAHRA